MPRNFHNDNSVNYPCEGYSTPINRGLHRCYITINLAGKIIGEKDAYNLFRVKKCIGKPFHSLRKPWNYWQTWRHRALDETTRSLITTNNNWEFRQLFRKNPYYFTFFFPDGSGWIFIVEQHCYLLLNEQDLPRAILYHFAYTKIKMEEFSLKSYRPISPTPEQRTTDGKQMITLLNQEVKKLWIKKGKLSPTRISVLKDLLVKGKELSVSEKTYKKIANANNIAESTVKTHIKKIKKQGPQLGPGLISPISIAQFLNDEGLLY